MRIVDRNVPLTNQMKLSGKGAENQEKIIVAGEIQVRDGLIRSVSAGGLCLHLYRVLPPPKSLRSVSLFSLSFLFHPLFLPSTAFPSAYRLVFRITCVQNKLEKALTPSYNKESEKHNLLYYKELRHGSLSYHIGADTSTYPEI